MWTFGIMGLEILISSMKIAILELKGKFGQNSSKLSIWFVAIF